MTDLTEEQVDEIVVLFVKKRVSDINRLTADLIDEMNALDRRSIKSVIDNYDSILFDQLESTVTS